VADFLQVKVLLAAVAAAAHYSVFVVRVVEMHMVVPVQPLATTTTTTTTTEEAADLLCRF